MKNSTYWIKSAVFAIALFCSYNSHSQNAVNVVNSFSGYAGVSSSSVFTLPNVQVLAGTNRLMLVGVSTKDGKVTSITYNNIPLNLVGYLDGTNMSTQAPIQNGSNSAEVYIYSYLNPPVGTANVVVTLDSDYKKGIVVGATNFSGVDQSNPLGTFTSAAYHDDNDSPFVLNVPSAVGSLIFDVSSVRNGTQTMNTGQTQLYNINSGSETNGGSSTKLATTTTTSMSWSSASCQEIGRAAIAINPSSPTGSNSSVSVTCDFVATQDTYIKLKNTGTNYGSCNTLIVDREKNDLHRILLQFDLSSIPAGTEIESAELRLFTDNGNNMNISVFKIGATDVWTEGNVCNNNGSANWIKRTATSNWSTAGVVGAFDGGTPIHTINGSPDGIHSWPITSLTQQWVDGTTVNNGVMVGSKDGGGDRTVDYYSRESSGVKPTLRITYNVNLDSDFDGIPDSVDIDDDNDGILDTDECDTIVNPPLLNADFEAIDILTLDGGPTDVVPTAGIWKGDASHIPNWLSADPFNNYLEIWHNSQAAGNDAGGRAYSGTHWAEVNATTNDGLYQDVVSTPGNVLQWAFAHRKRTGFAGSGSEDIVRLLIGNPSGTLTSQGDFASANDASWTLHTGTYVVPPGQTTTRLTFTVLNTVSGSTSTGNFIDNVQLYVIPDNCADTDGDGIPDYFDLDSDNDGIPDIVEAGLGSISNGKGTIPLSSFIDANKNGMHDPFENNIPLDSDGDGVPNFRDLDSDNDTVFDVDEAGTTRYSGPTLVFENGDGDIDGDGVGDGPESEAFRIKTVSGACLDFFGDGILDIYDFGSGTNQFGNLSQGIGPLYVKDTDNDGIPDYIDIQSDGSTFDIANSFYANLDANNDGIIDDTIDSDGDGILDLFDTNDALFGSPRDIDSKLQLFFDGRNDYILDASLTSGWGEVTLMGWIKIDSSSSGIRSLFGQNNFNLRLNADNSIYLQVSGSNLNSGVSLPVDQWVHVGASYSNSQGLIKLFINGEEVNSKTKTGNLASDTSNFTVGKNPASNSEFFKGYIDEIRLFNKALSNNELEKIIYQEIENNSGVVRGVIIPRDVTNFIDTETIVPLSWSNLVKYYRLDTFKGDITDNLTTPSIDVITGAKLFNIKKLDSQTAPMPFITNESGNLPDALTKVAKGVNGNDAITYDWSIVKIKHANITYSGRQKHLGLFIDQQDASSNSIEFSVLDDSELNVSWFLKLDGKIDLEGESQLIQGLDSNLSVGVNGQLERDQQGTSDTYTYNYWSSPVGKTDSGVNNYRFSVKDVMFDGDTPINFSNSGYNGANTTPIRIADYWIWKYANNPSGTYSAWQHVRQTGILKAGEGFTMKGPGSGAITDEQNYVFKGKPNNGNVNLTINAGNDYLVGNPYPSALDANQFILDNGPTISGGTGNPLISGTLYFWEHWGGGSHNLANYQGGYATYNLSGGVAAASFGTNSPLVSTGGVPKKLPGRYIPVSQGFFVSGESNGTINFNNGQRIFEKEGTNSVFVRSTVDNENSTAASLDPRPRIRLGFNSVNTIHRQLLLTVDENTTMAADWGYDAPLNDAQMDDMYWMIDTFKYVIQASDETNENTIYPIGVKTSSNGINTFTIDDLENVDENIDILLHDENTDTYHNLRESDYQIMLNAGEYLNRFSLRFGVPNALSVVDEELVNLNFYYSNTRDKIVVLNPKGIEIQNLELYNILGQSVYSNPNALQGNYSEYPMLDLSTGAYIIKIVTEEGTYSKKVIIK